MDRFQQNVHFPKPFNPKVGCNTLDGRKCMDQVKGCTDSKAANYNPVATTDDGTCIYYGCTDPAAADYDPFATINDGSCDYVIGKVVAGCTDPKAINYNSSANMNDGTCQYR